MRRIVLVLALFGILAGCQSVESDEDRPIIKAGDCKPREFESGVCVPE